MSQHTGLTVSQRFTEGQILLLNKPYGWTSFDLVRKVRNLLSRHLGLKKPKVGHAGTLDPLATGLMLLCTGKATKMIEELQNGEKGYRAVLKLGATTPSFDLETQVDQNFPTEHITLPMVEATLASFVGETEQVPPIFSAIKIEGKRAYEHARKGEHRELKPRTVVIRNIDITEFSQDTLKLTITCGKGTYIRSLARDLGISLGTGAHLIALERTQIGSYRLENALLPTEFEDFLQNEVVRAANENASIDVNIK